MKITLYVNGKPKTLRLLGDYDDKKCIFVIEDILNGNYIKVEMTSVQAKELSNLIKSMYLNDEDISRFER